MDCGAQCCLLTANIACHENGIPKNLPVKLTVCQKNCPSKSKYIEYLYKTIYYTLLSFASFQISCTRSHCISSMRGPFNETRIKSSKCSIFNRFLFISLMRFCLENPLSHETVLDGLTKVVCHCQSFILQKHMSRFMYSIAFTI